MINGIPTFSLSDLDELGIASLMKVETFIEAAARNRSWPDEDKPPRFANEASVRRNCDPAHEKVFEYLLSVIRRKYRQALAATQSLPASIILPLADIPEDEALQVMCKGELYAWFAKLAALPRLGEKAEDDDTHSYLEDHL